MMLPNIPHKFFFKTRPFRVLVPERETLIQFPEAA